MIGSFTAGEQGLSVAIFWGRFKQRELNGEHMKSLSVKMLVTSTVVELFFFF